MSDEKAKPKPLAEMTLAELGEENKRLGVKIRQLQARKADVEAAYTHAQEAQKAIDSVRSLSPAKRSALLRALEVQAAIDAKVAEVQKEKIASVARGVAEFDDEAAREAVRQACLTAEPQPTGESQTWVEPK